MAYKMYFPMGLPEAAAKAAAPGNRGARRNCDMKIMVDADRMHSIASDIRTTTDTLRYNMDSIERLVYSMDGEWKGDAERAFASKIVYVRNEFREVERFFVEYASLLERFAEEYIRHEDEVTAKLRNV